MSSDDPAAQGSAAHHLDADAVCAQCGTTNPEGTLICHNCGNNLRDQRHTRLQAEAVLLGQDRSPVLWWVTRGAFFVIVIVLAVVAFRAEDVSNWMVNSAEADVAELCWKGPQAPLFDAMRRELDGAYPEGQPFPEPQPKADGAVQGFYLLADPATGPVGVAIARIDGDQVRFLARLQSGHELRGSAVVANGRYVAQPDDAAARFGWRDFVRVSGSAQPMPEGGFICQGWSENSQDLTMAFAYPLPEPPAE